MAYTGRAPSQAPITSADINDGIIVPADLSTGAPSWDASGNLDVTGTVTADGLTVDGDAYISSSNARLRLLETDTTDLNTQLQNSGGDFFIKTLVDDSSASTTRFTIDHATGDISFYEDTGTTPKFFWDASTENLGLGTVSPSLSGFGSNTTGLEVSGTNAGIRLNGNAADSLYLISGSSKHWIFGKGAVPLTFSTDGTERMRIDSSGRVGIGTSSPSAWGGTWKPIQMAYGGAVFANTGIADIGLSSNAYWNSGSLTSNGVYIESDAASYYRQASGTHYWYGAASGTAGAGITWSERMRIDSDGVLLIGTTSSTIGSSNYLGCAISKATRLIGLNKINSGGATMISFNYVGTQVGSISSTNSGTSYNTASDYRLKEDWQPMSGSIDRVKALNPVNFAWKADGSRVDGFLAHEAQAVVPEAVTGEKDAVQLWEEGDELPEGVVVGDNKLDDDGNTIPDYQGIDQSKLVPLLTSALQEAVAKIEALETRIAALESN
jgi:hypothetical protein